ncbi:M23 family metallopeptidase [Algiphilus sp. NNCM1]|uniref:M23 family metallopeptidase n=1 Tax=Algiphilus sp. TaxID=1872431 RepID=UPI001CA65360|nr:M23 family metallopeptidase [Algiphilus sp.]MBY8967072.1 M23 family metallopeptidase [Algiphilus acroporae]MCI5062630.1 M23 family metallopeptidase [Algiphilus sp.]MCI5104377.1 M23 family metallopeptidase [Algiphilus sp.]
MSPLLNTAQLLLPLLLIAWILLLPPKARLTLWVQGLGTAALLLAMAWIALWAAPPWWTPWVLGAALVMAWTRALRMQWRHQAAWLPSGGLAWLRFTLFLLLGTFGAFYAGQAWEAGRPPAGVPVADIAPPLAAGQYLVVHGGSQPLLNGHMKTLDPEVERFAPWRGQSYAVDLIALDPVRSMLLWSQPEAASAYAIHGTPVLAPCAGTVIATENTRPDMPVPKMDRERMLGNFVLLQCRDFQVVLAHLQPGSLSVTPGVAVIPGDRLGLVGNSGNSSRPHLHVHAQRGGTADDPVRAEPMALRIGGHYPVRNDRMIFRAR